MTVSILRTEAGRDPHNKELHDLIGELSTRSDEFRTRWGCAQRPASRNGFQDVQSSDRGRDDTRVRGLEMAAEPGLTLTIYAAEPGSPSAERLQLLASWAASEYGQGVQPASEKSRTDS